MLAFRLTKPAYALDLSGTGARLYGGRWNPPGLACLYASENRALAALEVLVHATELSLHTVFKLITLEIAGDQELLRPHLNELPPQWYNYPITLESQTFGMQWLSQFTCLGFYVPSVVMPYEFNLILNVNHPRYPGAVRIVDMVDWKIDDRLVSLHSTNK